MSSETVHVVRAALDALNGRDFERAEELFAPDVEFDWSRSRGPLQGIHRGHAGLHFLAEEFWNTFAEVHIHADGFVTEGDEVRVPNTTRMLGREGVSLVARSTFAFAVADGRITRMRLFQEHPDAPA